MSTATAEKKTAEGQAKTVIGLNEANQALANAIAASITVNSDGTVVNDSDIVEANLPPDMTLADIKKHQKYRGQIMAAATDALRQKGLSVLAKNKDLDRVTMGFKFGDDQVELAVKRSQTFNDGKGGQITKYGYTSLGYTAKGTGNSGEFKKARDRLSDEAAKLFG